MTRISGGSSRPSAPKSESKSESKSSESKDEAPKSSEARGAEKEEVSEASKAERPEEAQRTQKEDQAREAQERERDTSHFEQQKPSNGPVELNPASKADEAEAASTDAQREKEIRAQLEKTNTGREAQRTLSEAQTQLAFEDGDRAYYEPATNRVMVGRNLSPVDASSAVVNEATHAEASARGTSPDPTQGSREEYVNGMLREEAESSAREIEHRRELTEQGLPAGTTTSLDNAYSDTMVNAMVNGASETDARQAARQAVAEGLQRGDTVASVSGQNYADYYGQQYDRVQSGEVAAADVVRSDDQSPRLQNPGKIGVVLNAPADGTDPKTGKPALPTAAELSQQGVGRARITVSAAYLQNDPNAQPGQPGSEINPAKLQAWENQLRDYKNSGIEVTLNLPPELVNGLPEFQRNGPIRDDGDMLKQTGEVQDIPDSQWNTYQNAYVQRTGELAQRLGPYVDSWEAGNEPDAHEKVIIKGKVPEGERQAYVTDQRGVRHEVNGSFDPGMPPRRYGQLLNAAYDTIKANDNGARDPNNPTQRDANNKNTVITAGMVAGDAAAGLYGNTGQSYLEKVAAATNEPLKFDGVAVHPYTRNTQEQFNETVQQYSDMLSEKLGRPDVPVYITEASPGPGDANDPGYQRAHNQYTQDISRATDTNNSVAGTYFFWGGSFDSHRGLADMPQSSRTLRQLLGK
jgi:hypothetical protein